MWPFLKKAEKPAHVAEAEKIPIPIPDDGTPHDEPVTGIVQEPASAPIADNSCILVESVPDSTPNTVPAAGVPEDDMTRDLALRVMEALDAWRTKYHLENLPDKIVLTQAMNILHVMKNAL